MQNKVLSWSDERVTNSQDVLHTASEEWGEKRNGVCCLEVERTGKDMCEGM